MSKFKTIAVSGALLAALGLSTGSLLMAYMNRPMPKDETKLKPVDLKTVGPYTPNAAKGDQVVELSRKTGSAVVEWVCGKSLAGKHVEDHHGEWENIAGAVAFNGKAGQVLAVDLHFSTKSFQSDAEGLTRTVTTDQLWFDVDQFPEATFSATEFAPRTPELEKALADAKAAPMAGWTHLIKGQFTLNGITQALSIPAKIAVGAASAKIEAQFPISRAAFKVEKRKDSLAGAAASLFDVDDAVRLSVKIVAAPDPAALIGELTDQVRAQKEEIGKLTESVKKHEDRFAKLEGDLEDLKNAAPAQAAAPPVDISQLPKSFTDELVNPPSEKDYTFLKDGKEVKGHFSYHGMKAPFKMILVPGDPAKGIRPFYMGETEVTWEMFKQWSHWEDATLPDATAELAQKLRPSNVSPYADTSHGMSYDEGMPAMGMSRLNAEKFCEYLSKKTGRKYRLPTEAEWDLAYALGGGDPADKADAAWYKESSDDTTNDNIDQGDKLFAPRVGKVKTKAPNKLGLYDMLGNVAEWVKTPGKAAPDGTNTFVRGGDFLTPEAKLTGKLREESNSAVWNATYPNTPKSIWWFKDHFQVGFRLVCEPVNIPKP